jgi:hypothetical protein
LLYPVFSYSGLKAYYYYVFRVKSGIGIAFLVNPAPF